MTEWIARHAEAPCEASQARRKVQKEFGNPTSTRTTCCPNYTIRVRHHNTRFQLMRWLRRKRPNLQRAETEENLSKTLGYTMGQTRLVQDGGPPVGPSQRLSKIQPQQAKAIEEKQAKAVQQYTGAIQVLEVARSQWTQVHWDMSGRSDAWRLPVIQGVLQKLHLGRVTTHGCCVGLRAADGKLRLYGMDGGFRQLFHFAAHEPLMPEQSCAWRV